MPVNASEVIHDATHPQRGLNIGQRAIRAHAIGGSEIAAVLGIDDFRGQLDVYAEKVHGIRKPPTPEMRWGNYAEEAALAYLAEECGIVTYKPRDAAGNVTTLVHPEFPWVCATPDGLELPASEHHRVVEVKNVGRWMLDAWGDVSATEVPLKYRAQIVWTIGVTSALGLSGATGLLVPMMAGEPPNDWQYIVEYSEPTFLIMVKAAKKFMVECVEARREPEGWEYDPHALDYVKNLYTSPTDELREATTEAVTALRQWRYAKVRLAKWKAVVDESQVRICNQIGNAQGMASVGTWKANVKGVRTFRPEKE